MCEWEPNVVCIAIEVEPSAVEYFINDPLTRYFDNREWSFNGNVNGQTGVRGKEKAMKPRGLCTTKLLHV